MYILYSDYSQQFSMYRMGISLLFHINDYFFLLLHQFLEYYAIFMILEGNNVLIIINYH